MEGTLPPVSYIKSLGIRTGHPTCGNLKVMQQFSQDILDLITKSPIYKDKVLFIQAEDESGGFYDHITPPPTSPTDNIGYGARIANLFMGHFVKNNYISHVPIEHSSLVKFIEWNFLNGETGQLNTRDTEVNNIFDLLDPVKAGLKNDNLQ